MPADDAARRTFRTGVLVAAVIAPLQVFVGDLHGLNTLEYQPAKIAAIEGLWKTQTGAPLVLFAIPNEATRRNDFALEIPRGAALILKHDSEGKLKGLDDFEPDRPPVAPVFWAFRIMVGLGFSMLALAWLGTWLLRGGRPPMRWLLWCFAGFTFSGWLATLAGWMVTEIGRQPWLVRGILRTADAVGSISGAQVGASLAGYIVTYAVMFIAYMVVLTHLAGKGSAPLVPAAEMARTSA